MQAKLLLATLALVAQPAEAEELLLQCVGHADVIDAAGVSTVHAENNHGNAASGTVARSERRTLEMVIDFELKGDVARARVPRELRPSFSKDKDGWYNVTNLLANDRIITGDIALGPFSKTKLEIDRITGVMTTKRGFRADCRAADLSARKF